MDDLQLIKPWDEWDNINLSTYERRIERLEILLCQKVHRGEDITQCLQVLSYLKNRNTEHQLETLIFQKVRSQLSWNFWYKISQGTLAMLITFSCCVAALKLINSFPFRYNLPGERQSINIPDKTPKHYKHTH